MKITKQRLKEIIREELQEVYSKKQRKWACAQDDPKFDEMCSGPMKKKKVK